MIQECLLAHSRVNPKVVFHVAKSSQNIFKSIIHVYLSWNCKMTFYSSGNSYKLFIRGNERNFYVKFPEQFNVHILNSLYVAMYSKTTISIIKNNNLHIHNLHNFPSLETANAIVYTNRCGGFRQQHTKKCLLLEINPIAKFLLFKMKYGIDGGCLFDQ